MPTTADTTIAQPFHPVNPVTTGTSNPSPETVIHHNVPFSIPRSIIVRLDLGAPPPYGVSPSQRLITRELYIRRFDRIRECLVVRLGLTCAQREVVLRLLRLWAFYGLVYPKASQVAELPGCSTATFWRTVRLLRDENLVQVIHRYLIRPHAQISNIYRLDELAALIFTYLQEHGQAYVADWMLRSWRRRPIPSLPWPRRPHWQPT